MALRDEIAGWDSKSADAISDIYQRYADRESFLDDIVDFLNEPALQPGATWLLKHHLEDGRSGLDLHLNDRIYAALPGLQHWASKLHVLQCLPHMTIPSKRSKDLEVFLRACLTDTNKFVRAWSYGAFHALAAQHREYRDEATQIFARALSEEAPAVRARVRQVVKRGFERAPQTTKTGNKI